MIRKDLRLRRAFRSVQAIWGPKGLIGTSTVVGPGLALTALHVIAPEPTDRLEFVHPTAVGHRGLAARAVAALPLDWYGSDIALARRSHERATALTGADLGTVDLALLSVPGLRAPALPIRAGPVRDGEPMVVPGYPSGLWSITRGPVIGHDEADFIVHLLLGPGASGAPVIDQAGRVGGVVTLDNEAGAICIGPGLIGTFLRELHVRHRQR